MPSEPPIVFVTGAGRGIGLELVRQYLADGSTIVAATPCPFPALEALQNGRLQILDLDVRDPIAVKAAADSLTGQISRIDILYNNAGIVGAQDHFEDFAAEDFLNVIRVNTVAPLLLAKALRPLLGASPHGRALTMTSRTGVLFSHQATSGGGCAYSASKAAFQRMLPIMAADLKASGITCVGIDPGFVETDMTRGFAGNRPQLQPEQSVRGIRQVAAALTREHSGCLLRWNGRTCRWMAPPETVEDMQLAQREPFVLDPPPG